MSSNPAMGSACCRILSRNGFPLPPLCSVADLNAMMITSRLSVAPSSSPKSARRWRTSTSASQRKVRLIVSHSTGTNLIAKCRVSATSSGRRRRRKRHLNGSNRRSRAGQGRTLSRLKRNVASSKRRGGEIRNVICDLSGTEAEGGVVDGIS